MESTRQQKINRLIQKELSDIFLLQTKQMQGVLVSVSSVRISPDLGVAKVYLSIFPSDKGVELLKNINTNVKSIRYDIGQRMGKQLRIIPEFVFYLDDSLDYLEKIDKLLKTADNKKNTESEE
ncbi:MAG: 30S ribosome-binding factor RbfA [Dysgonomonas sp.]